MSTCSPLLLLGPAVALFFGVACKEDFAAAGRAAMPERSPTAEPLPAGRPTTVMPRPAAPIEYAGSHILVAYRGALHSTEPAERASERSKREALAFARVLTKRASQAPQDFTALARKLSDAADAPQGGRLGSWKRGSPASMSAAAVDPLLVLAAPPATERLPELAAIARQIALRAAIEQLAMGAVAVEPIETRFGYHLVRRDPPRPLLAGAQILIAHQDARGQDPREKAKTRRTLTAAHALATALAARLKLDPDKFVELAAKHSDGPAAQSGGLLGVWRQGELTYPRAIDRIVGALAIGQVSEPTETTFGVHLFRRLPLPPRLAASHILIAWAGAQRPPDSEKSWCAREGARCWYDVRWPGGYVRWPFGASRATRSKDEALRLARELALQVAQRPERFGALALRYSDCASLRFGGDLGGWHRGAIAETFAAAIDQLVVGQVAGTPVETPFGFHVIRRQALPREAERR